MIIGPMFSGKSTELLRRVRRYRHASYNCLVVKYRADTRYSVENLATHDEQMTAAVPCSRLDEVEKDLHKFDVVAVDEGQFFPDLLHFCETAAIAGKVVIVAALDATFERKPFGDVCNLVARAEGILKLSAVCKFCHADAAFTRRLGADTAVELIGGSEMYVPVCRPCFSVPIAPVPETPPARVLATASSTSAAVAQDNEQKGRTETEGEEVDENDGNAKKGGGVVKRHLSMAGVVPPPPSSSSPSKEQDVSSLRTPSPTLKLGRRFSLGRGQ